MLMGFFHRKTERATADGVYSSGKLNRDALKAKDIAEVLSSPALRSIPTLKATLRQILPKELASWHI
jgi:hypothetical protein